MIKLLRTAAFLLCTAFTAPVMAQDFDKGLAAYNVEDYETALQEWLPLAEQGDVRAQGWVGELYFFGRGTPRDYAEAVKWFRLAAEQGDVVGQGYLGEMYSKGYGVPQDFAEAVKWWRLVTEQGKSYGPMSLAKMYDDGIGTLQDKVRAHMWYSIGAALGDAYGAHRRVLLAWGMSYDEISKAEAMARECMASDYQDCG
jgi:TPR repeat protein